MIKNRSAVLLLLSLVLQFTVKQQIFAQDTTVLLQLNDLVEQATTNNQYIRLAKMDEQIAISGYNQTKAVFLPHAGLSYSALSSNDPLNAFGFNLQQKSVSQQDFDPTRLNDPPATQDFMTQLSIEQPLVNMDMLYMRKSALKQTEIYPYKTQRTKEQIIYRSWQAYLQLQLAYDVQKVLQEALETTKAIYKFTNDRYVQGLLQRSDLLNVEVQIKTIESKLADAKSNISNASDHISLLMNKAAGIIYKPITGSVLPDDLPAADTLSPGRADFKAMEKAIAAYDLLIKSSRMSYLPKLNAFANYQLHDKSMLGFGSGAYMGGIRLSWDIFKGNSTKNKIATQKLERNKMMEELNRQKEESRVEMISTNRRYADAGFKINQQQAAIDYAKEALRIIQNRYLQGLVNTTDVLMAQTQLSQQQLAYAEAQYNKNIAKAYLRFLGAGSQ